MDEMCLQLLELVRAGWVFQISAEKIAPGMYSPRIEITWVPPGGRTVAEDDSVPDTDDTDDETPPPRPFSWAEALATLPRVTYINAFAPSEVRGAIALMHAKQFPLSSVGDLPPTTT